MKISLTPKYSGYILPWSKREVSAGEVVEVPDAEGERLIRKGKFFLVDGNENSLPGFSAGKQAISSFPKAWDGAEVCIKCSGGIGDCLIASSVSIYAKRCNCHVTMAVPKAAIPFVSFVDTVDDVIFLPASSGRNWDILLEMSDFMKKGHEMIQEEVYQRAHEVGHVPLGKIKLPHLGIPNISRQIRDMIPTEKSVVFHIGATTAHRRWPLKKWRELCKTLTDEGLKVFLLGKNENLAAQKIGCNDCTHLPVGDQLNIMARCSFAVCVDSCWCHIAGLLGKPAVGLYGPSRPYIWGARYPSVMAITAPEGVCQGCHALRERQCIHNEFLCMDRIGVDQVLERTRRHFKRFLKKKKRTKMPSTPAPARDKTEPLERRLRVLSVLPYEMLGGGEVVTLEVAKELEKYFDVTVAHLIGQNDASISSVVFAKSLNLSNYIAIHDRLMLSELFHEHDVVLWYGTGVEDVPEMIRRCKSRPVSIPTIHTSFTEEADFIRKYADITDEVFCVNPEIAESLNGQFVPNMVNLSRIQGGKAVHEFSNDLPVVGFLGRFDDNKRAKWVVDGLSDLKCNVVAQGDSGGRVAEDLVASARKQGVPDRLKVLPYSDNVADFFASIDVLALPSKAEGFPLVAVEAAMLGIPVVVTENCALPHLFRDLMVYLPYEEDQDISALRNALDDALRTDTLALKKRATTLCTPSEVGRRYRQLIRQTYGKSLPVEIQSGVLSIIRRDGAGDVIMATSVLSKMQEMLPKARLRFETSKKMIGTVSGSFPECEVTDVESADSFRIDVDYHKSWEREIHALEGMGGNEHEMRVSWPPRTTAGRPRVKTRVACVMYQNHTAGKKTKEWGEKNWRKLAAELKKRGYVCSQLGSVEGKSVRGFVDNRTETVEEFVSYIEDADIVIGIEGIANHIGRVLNKPCVVLVGGSSSEEHTSYSLHTHVKTPSECRCWASICDKWAKDCQCECMKEITVDSVIDAVEAFNSQNG